MANFENVHVQLFCQNVAMLTFPLSTFFAGFRLSTGGEREREATGGLGLELGWGAGVREPGEKTHRFEAILTKTYPQAKRTIKSLHHCIAWRTMHMAQGQCQAGPKDRHLNF